MFTIAGFDLLQTHYQNPTLILLLFGSVLAFLGACEGMRYCGVAGDVKCTLGEAYCADLDGLGMRLLLRRVSIVSILEM